MNTSTKFFQLKSFDILKDLTESELDSLAKAATYKKVAKGKHIYSEGEEQRNVYLLDKGVVEIGALSNNGRKIIKDLIYEKSLFGENVFIPTNRKNEFARAMSDDVNLMTVPIDAFKNLLETNYLFADKVMQSMLEKLKYLERRVENFVFKKAKNRIIDFIITTAERKGIKIGIDECLINHGMSHKEIAYLTDTSRQTVARVLGDLKRANLIHFSARKPSKILIRDFANLKA